MFTVKVRLGKAMLISVKRVYYPLVLPLDPYYNSVFQVPNPP
jgi:hypothetical protein